MKAIQFVCALALALALLPASSAYADESRAQSGSTVEAPTSIRAELIRIASTPGYRLGQVPGTGLFSPDPGKPKRPGVSPDGPSATNAGPPVLGYYYFNCGGSGTRFPSAYVACQYRSSYSDLNLTRCVNCGSNDP